MIATGLMLTLFGHFVDVLSDWLRAVGDWLDVLSYGPQAVGDWLAHSDLILVAIGFNIAPWFLPGVILLLAAKFFIVLPIRRHERAHVFLDLLEMGLAQGRSPENMIVEIASTGDKTLGPEFVQLGERIRDGASFGRALEMSPGLLPEPVVAMIQAGARMGDIRKVLPICRDVLAAGPSRAMGAFNYLPVFAPLLPLLALAQFIAIIILPKFNEILDEMADKKSLPATTQILAYYAEHNVLLGLGVVGVAVIILTALLKRIRRRWPSVYPRTTKPLWDQFLLLLPWRRKRTQRDFSAMLAILLDADVPEFEAVTLAAESTANLVFLRRSRRIVESLRQGSTLMDAIRALDDTGEFHWRLRNATQAHAGFLRALQGWHETLEAQAYQQEQAISQVFSAVLIVVNGILACVVALAIFQPLIAVIQQGVLW